MSTYRHNTARNAAIAHANKVSPTTFIVVTAAAYFITKILIG